MRLVLVLINPESGLRRPLHPLRRAIERYWGGGPAGVRCQLTRSPGDGAKKVQLALERGVDTVLVAGGDGTVSSVGRALIGTDAALGVIPTGSGNGFARHFGIPLSTVRAVRALAEGRMRLIDVGSVNDHPFFVTCSLAWDAALVESFEKMPFRGIVPYIFAGVQKFFQYHPQDMEVVLDAGETLKFEAPLVFTMANLTEYGFGVRIAPHALSDDGRVELVVVCRQDIPLLLMNLKRCLSGAENRVPGLFSRSVTKLVVKREHAAPAQVDGELVDMPAEIKLKVLHKSLKVIVP